MVGTYVFHGQLINACMHACMYGVNCKFERMLVCAAWTPFVWQRGANIPCGMPKSSSSLWTYLHVAPRPLFGQTC
jgi:hypothetical protein